MSCYEGAEVFVTQSTMSSLRPSPVRCTTSFYVQLMIMVFCFVYVAFVCVLWLCVCVGGKHVQIQFTAGLISQSIVLIPDCWKASCYKHGVQILEQSLAAFLYVNGLCLACACMCQQP